MAKKPNPLIIRNFVSLKITYISDVMFVDPEEREVTVVIPS